MIIKNYILTTVRLIIAKWWLSLIKLFSLTSGITSFLLVWLFYFDHQFFFGNGNQAIKSNGLENVLLLAFIFFVTILIYFLVMKSQISFRHKELFIRKFYGESSNGIVAILIIETSIFILIAFMLSLILIDQIAPFFNAYTRKNVTFKSLERIFDMIMITCFLLLMGIIGVILPSIWYARIRAIDILKKLQ